MGNWDGNAYFLHFTLFSCEAVVSKTEAVQVIFFMFYCLFSLLCVKIKMAIGLLCQTVYDQHLVFKVERN